MGFFQDLKEDLSQAVNELMPDEKSGESDLDSEMLSKDEDVTIFDSEVPEDITELNSLLDDISSYEENEVEEEKSLEQALEEELAALEDTENEELEANENPIKRVEIFTNYKGEKNMDVQNSNSKVLDETALITAGMTITGDVNSKGSIEVIGNIVGDRKSVV